MLGEIHVGDTTALNVVLKNTGNKVRDLSETTDITMVVKRPDNSYLTKKLDFSTDGKDGRVHIKFEKEDFNVEGIYYYQIWVTWPDDVRHSRIVTFNVEPNLTPVAP